MPRPPRDTLLVCADVLGAFGVTAADIDRRRDGPSDESLEAALADALSDGRNRTTVLRRTIARSDRGLNCAARYARESLERELTAVFEAIDWSFSLSATGRGRGAPQQMYLEATDHGGRRRETTVEYPDTPLGTDNLPAVLHAINDSLLSGTDARFVLLSSGVDRWRAALVDERELERLRDRYGPRITAVERPLLPDHGLEAYVPSEAPDGADEPWPAWAHDRERDRRSGYDASDETTVLERESESEDDGIESLIEEAESGVESASERSNVTEAAPSDADAASETQQQETDTANRTTSPPSRKADGFELRGSPTVSRVSDGEDSSRTTAEASERGSDDARADAANSESESVSTSVSAAKSESEPESDDDGFGTLSGTTTTTRVSNDSFGSDVEWETENERYRALGAALGAGGNVSVEGLLEDDDFLPELPAVEPEEQRIEFDDPFDPDAVREAKAAAEQSGFVWVDSGTLETTRLSNG
ncbi:hypothetical protein [Halopiger xanaduensis]|uniref:Uncharacterized protein n=1 Tax=Halopiger xanaduensis (strain DSM 18323 / JCM 14033 / SH-6) TaxID=797210 RepID=F8DAH9_HALXS|nr:hypothetical protein [Halopiger xanaduensis]AEH35784.1 hypothetical protein Halxa_1151 [Halopiger xanaduensis SH-6]